MSSSGIAVSEKHSDIPFGDESRSGIPFNLLMRDILQFDESLEQSIQYRLNYYTYTFTDAIGEYKVLIGHAQFGLESVMVRRKGFDCLNIHIPQLM